MMMFIKFWSWLMLICGVIELLLKIAKEQEATGRIAILVVGACSIIYYYLIITRVL